jgi:hypothetical protein|tara:strand:+ start:470 stop:628 length:159 start_codon:yes stop_codon:yes gene_type:complete
MKKSKYMSKMKKGGSMKKTKYMSKGGAMKNTKYRSKGGAVKKSSKAPHNRLY